MTKSRRRVVPDLDAASFDVPVGTAKDLPKSMKSSEPPTLDPKEDKEARLGRPLRHTTERELISTNVRLSAEHLEWLDQIVIELKRTDRGVTRSEVLRTLCDYFTTAPVRFTVVAKGDVRVTT